MDNGVPTTLLPLLEIWKAPQVGLPQVIRWKKYIDRDQGVRTQDSLQHSHAITILGTMMMAQLSPYVRLDCAMVIAALAIHDVGEGEINKDTLYIDKTTAGDLEEYVAFRRRYEPLGDPRFGMLHRAFLLQFAGRNPAIFPDDARHIMDNLARHSFLETLMFEAVERWDYVLYALEQYHERGNEKILAQTLRHQVGPLGVVAKELPGFREEIWTDEVSSWALVFLKEREGKWIEKKKSGDLSWRIDLFSAERILVKRSLVPGDASMPCLVESSDNPTEPLKEFIAAGVSELAKLRNALPPNFRRVRENLVTSANVFGPLAVRVGAELPNNYFAAVVRRRIMA